MVDVEKNLKPNFPQYESVDFDKAIQLTGYGKFHYETLLVSAICILSVGFQNGLSAYVFPAAQCELRLTSSQLGFLNISFLIGGTLSSFIWGFLADTCGRKNILVITHLSNALITILCAFNQYVIALVVCRILNGFLIAAPGSIIFSYLAEFQPPKYRSSVLCYSGLFFTSSWLLLPILAAFILPLDVSFTFSSFFTVSSWRIFLVILIIPEIIVGLWFIRLPESPKFFLAKGDHKKALIVLREMFSRNTGKCPNEFPINKLSVFSLKTEYGEIQNVMMCNGKFARVVHEISIQFKNLFHPPILFISLLTSTIMFTNMFGVFGLGLWLPELFIKFQQFQNLYPNKTASVRELVLLNEIKNQSCQPSFDSSVIQNTITMGVSSILGNILSGFFASRVQLKTIPCISMLLGGLSAFSIFWLKSSLQNLIVASIFQAAMVTANMTIGSVTVELFPTKIGAMAICLIMCAGRIGAIASNVVFAFLIDKHCEIPIFVVAVNVLIGSGLCFMIPKEYVVIPSANSYVGDKNIEISVISSTKL